MSRIGRCPHKEVLLYVINNFANSNHVKEMIERTKELESHIFGPPRPHSSWREFLLMTVIVGVLVGILIKIGKKYMFLGLIKYIQKRSKDKTPSVPSISENLPQVCQKNAGVTDKYYS